ncbi:MAG TPA: hypothetical protein VFD44_00335, partial [Hanamia sp.]|nr:hypothetical protein [Hanamia sp.]
FIMVRSIVVCWSMSFMKEAEENKKSCFLFVHCHTCRRKNIQFSSFTDRFKPFAVNRFLK